MPKPPKWIDCPAGCHMGRTGIPQEKIEEMAGVIDGCFGPHWWESYPVCGTCQGTGRVDARAKKKTELFPSNVPMIVFPELLTPEIVAMDEQIGLEQEEQDD